MELACWTWLLLGQVSCLSEILQENWQHWCKSNSDVDVNLPKWCLALQSQGLVEIMIMFFFWIGNNDVICNNVSIPLIYFWNVCQQVYEQCILWHHLRILWWNVLDQYLPASLHAWTVWNEMSVVLPAFRCHAEVSYCISSCMQSITYVATTILQNWSFRYTMKTQYVAIYVCMHAYKWCHTVSIATTPTHVAVDLQCWSL